MNSIVQPQDLVDLARDHVHRVAVQVAINEPSADVDHVQSRVQSAATPHTVEVSRPALVPREQVDGTTIREDTVEAFLSAEGELVAGVLTELTFTPAPGQTLVWSGRTHRIVQVQVGGAGSEPVGYLLRFHT